MQFHSFLGESHLSVTVQRKLDQHQTSQLESKSGREKLV